MELLTEVTLEFLAEVIVDAEEQDTIADFIMELDMRVADYDFTKSLIEKLQKTLDEEDIWQKDE